MIVPCATGFYRLEMYSAGFRNRYEQFIKWVHPIYDSFLPVHNFRFRLCDTL